MANKELLGKLAQLEQLFTHYQAKTKKIKLQEQSEQVQQQVARLSAAHSKLQQELKKQTSDQAAALTSTLEQASTLSEEELTAALQETWPDFLPTTVEIIEHCYLTVYTVGILTYEEGGTPFDSTSFAINEQTVEHLKVKKNSKGTIVIYSNWRFHQKNESIGFHSYANSISHSIKNYKITCTFEVDADGTINIYKDAVLKITEEDASIMDLIFVTKSIDIDLDNADRLSISGGTQINTTAVFPKGIKQWLSTKTVGKAELIRSFSLKLSAAKAEKAPSRPVAPVEKELVFEKENQAVLSSDQLRVLYQWWKELKPELKSKIQEQKAQVVITGYASNTGTERYNQQLGKKRAEDAKKILLDLIGNDSSNKPIADIISNSEGEWIENPRRCLKIVIRSKQ